MRVSGRTVGVCREIRIKECGGAGVGGEGENGKEGKTRGRDRRKS